MKIKKNKKKCIKKWIFFGKNWLKLSECLTKMFYVTIFFYDIDVLFLQSKQNVTTDSHCVTNFVHQVDVCKRGNIFYYSKLQSWELGIETIWM